MGGIAFDTLEFARKLKGSDFTVEQAEGLAQAVAGIVDEQLATKRDLKELELALKSDMKELEVTLRRDMKELEMTLKRDMKELEMTLKRDMTELELRLKHDLTLRLGGMMAAGIAVVAALVKLL